MKTLLSLLLILSLYSGISAQVSKPDIIFKKDQKRIDAVIIEVALDHVKYHLFEDSLMLRQSIKKTEIARIVYANGAIESFETPGSEAYFSTDSLNPPPVEPRVTRPAPTTSQAGYPRRFNYTPKGAYAIKIQSWETENLQQERLYQSKKSRSNIQNAIIGISAGFVLAGVGAYLMLDNNLSYARFQQGTRLYAIGFVGAIGTGAFGFTKGGLHGGKSRRLGWELRSRGVKLRTR